MANINYNCTYAAVIISTVYKILLALIAVHDFKAHQIDIIMAFLNNFIRKHSIYVHQPKGFED